MIRGLGTAAPAAGWLGAVLLLLAYLLVSTGRLPGEGRRFQSLNILGSIGLGTAAAAGGVWSSAALNALWIGVGLWVLIRRRASSPGRGASRSSQPRGGALPQRGEGSWDE